MSKEESTKDRVLLLLIATVSVVTIFVGASYLWKQYGFRLWICETTSFCFNIMPMPPEYRAKVEEEWKEKTGKSMNDF